MNIKYKLSIIIILIIVIIFLLKINNIENFKTSELVIIIPLRDREKI